MEAKKSKRKWQPKKTKIKTYIPSKLKRTNFVCTYLRFFVSSFLHFTLHFLLHFFIPHFHSSFLRSLFFIFFGLRSSFFVSSFREGVERRDRVNKMYSYGCLELQFLFVGFWFSLFLRREVWCCVNIMEEQELRVAW